MRRLPNQTKSSRAQANARPKSRRGRRGGGGAAAVANARLPSVAPSRPRRIGEQQSNAAPEQSKERTGLSPRRNGRTAIASGRPLPAARHLPKDQAIWKKHAEQRSNADRSNFSLFFSEKEGCEEALTPSSPGVRFAQTANNPTKSPPSRL